MWSGISTIRVLGWCRKKYNHRMLDGTETYVLIPTSNPNYNIFYTPISGKAWILNGTRCSHFKNDGTSNNNGIYTISDRTTNGALSFAVPKTITTNAEMQVYMTSLAPVEIVYRLATPTRTPLIFTKNNASTFPELPMEDIEGTPNAMYPAMFYDAEGEMVVRGKSLANYDTPEVFPSTKVGVTINRQNGLYSITGTTSGYPFWVVSDVTNKLIAGQIYTLSKKWCNWYKTY